MLSTKSSACPPPLHKVSTLWSCSSPPTPLLPSPALIFPSHLVLLLLGRWCGLQWICELENMELRMGRGWLATGIGLTHGGEHDIETHQIHQNKSSFGLLHRVWTHLYTCIHLHVLGWAYIDSSWRTKFSWHKVRKAFWGSFVGSYYEALVENLFLQKTASWGSQSATITAPYTPRLWRSWVYLKTEACLAHRQVSCFTDFSILLAFQKVMWCFRPSSWGRVFIMVVQIKPLSTPQLLAQKDPLSLGWYPASEPSKAPRSSPLLHVRMHSSSPTFTHPPDGHEFLYELFLDCPSCPLFLSLPPDTELVSPFSRFPLQCIFQMWSLEHSVYKKIHQKSVHCYNKFEKPPSSKRRSSKISS